MYLRDSLQEMMKNSFKTGDYSKIEEMIKKMEQENIALLEDDKNALKSLKYFTARRKKIDFNLFSEIDEYGLKVSIFEGNLDKIEKYLKKYETFQVFEWIKAGAFEKVEEALEKGLNPNKETGRGKSLLLFAVKAGQEKLVEQLIDKGAKINPPFFHRGKSYIIDLLIKNGAQIMSSLFQGGKSYVFEFLIESGSQIMSSSLQKGRSYPALLEALDQKNTKIALLLLSKGADIMPRGYPSHILMRSITTQNQEVLDEILKIYRQKYAGKKDKKKKFLGNTPSLLKGGITPLEMAIRLKNTEIVKKLLNVGASSVIPFANQLEMVVKSQDKDMIDLFYEKANKEGKAKMAYISRRETLPDVMFYLYQKKCPVFPEEINNFTSEKIIYKTIFQKNKPLFDEIMRTLSDTEKERIDWEKIKTKINDYPPEIKNPIKKTFKELFQKEHTPFQQPEAVPYCCNQTQKFSVSGTLSDELTSKPFAHAHTPVQITRHESKILPQNEERGSRTE